MRRDPFSRSSGEDDVDLVHVAPRPVLACLRRSNEWMPALVEVGGCMTVRRRVAAADPSAGQAHAQMQPPIAGLQALLAAVERGG
jgi:hypothetical protein